MDSGVVILHARPHRLESQRADPLVDVDAVEILTGEGDERTDVLESANDLAKRLGELVGQGATNGQSGRAFRYSSSPHSSRARAISIWAGA